MKQFYIFFIFILCSVSLFSQNNREVKSVNMVMNQWHKDVAAADFDAYFNKMTTNSIFIGTDVSEVWSKKQFEAFAKPYFKKKKTWDFTPMDRNIYFSKDLKTAWFDEILNTWMGLCRGSGVLIKEKNSWKIVHYVLSVTVPNDDIKVIIEVKKNKDSLFISNFKN
ncbi:MAG: hypothetical protein GQ552_01345 [Flavobacteriaceae bacterium]|nr:hypothetical protein [Flavobacteriaceae bacterium]